MPRAADAARRTPTADATPTPTPRQADAEAPVGEVSGAAARRMPVPILMYHVISKAPAGVPNAELWVDQHVFADEMRALRAAEVHGGHARAGLGRLEARRPAAQAPGRGLLRRRLPLALHARQAGAARARLAGRPEPGAQAIGPGGLTEHQIRSLMEAGWEIDSHTLTHPDLTTLDDAALEHELVESRRELRKRFGVPADFFAYPAGTLRRPGRRRPTRAAGYKAATTVDEGIARGRDDPFALKRVRVNASDTADTLLAKLGG